MGNQTLNIQQINLIKKRPLNVQNNVYNKHVKCFNKKPNQQFLMNEEGQELLKINLSSSQLKQQYLDQQLLNIRKTKKLQNLPNLLAFNWIINNKKYQQKQCSQVQCIFKHPARSLKQQINQRLQLSQSFQQNQILTILHSCLSAFQEITLLLSQNQKLKQKTFFYLQNLNISDEFIFISKSGSIIFSDILSIRHKKQNQFCKKKCIDYQQTNSFQTNMILKLATVAKNCLIKINSQSYQTKSSLNINRQSIQQGLISVSLKQLILQMELNKIQSFRQAKLRLEQLNMIKVKNSLEKLDVLTQNKQFWSQRKNRGKTNEKSNIKNEKNNDNSTKIRLSLKKIRCKQKLQSTAIKNQNKLNLNLQNKILIAKNNKQNQCFIKEKVNNEQHQKNNCGNKNEIHKLKSRKQSMEKLITLNVQNYNCDKKKLDITEHLNPITSKNMLKNHFLKKDSTSSKGSLLGGQFATSKKCKQSETKQSSQDKFNSVQINPLSLQFIQNLSSILSNHGSITLSLSNALNEQLKTQHSQNHQDQAQRKQPNFCINDANQYNPGQLMKKCQQFIQQSNIKNYYQNYFKKNNQKEIDVQTSKDKIPQFLQKFKLPQKNLLTLKNMLLTQKDVIMQESFQQSELNSYRQNYEDDKRKSTMRSTQNSGVNKINRRIQIQKIQIKVLQQSCQLQDLSKDSIEKQIMGLQNSLQECRQI